MIDTPPPVVMLACVGALWAVMLMVAAAVWRIARRL